MSLRVMQAMAGARQGGAENFFMRLVPALGRAGLTQQALVRRHPLRARQLQAAGVPAVELPFGGAFDLQSRLAWRRELARFRPDLVMTWMNRASRFCPSGPFVRVARLGGYYKLKNFRGFDHLVCNTRDLVDYVVREGWPAARAHYIPNFADITPAEPEPRARHDTPDQVPLLLALGRLHANKAMDVAIRALTLIPDAYLWIAGEGPLRRELEDLAAAQRVADRVRFLGWCEDTGPLYAAADLCVFPSRFEPFGNVVVEAWARRLPLVAAASAGPAALVEDQKTGLLVPIDDGPALAAAVNRLLGDPDLAAALAAAGEIEYHANYSEAAVVGRYLDLFERVTG